VILFVVVGVVAGCGENTDSSVVSGTSSESASQSTSQGRAPESGASTCSLGDDVVGRAQEVANQYRLVEPEAARDIPSLISVRQSPRLLEGRVEKVERVQSKKLPGFDSLEAETGNSAYWAGVELAVVGPEANVTVPVVLRVGGEDVLQAATLPEDAYRALEALVGACAVVVNGEGGALSTDAPVAVVSGRSGRPISLSPETAKIVSSAGSLREIAAALKDAIEEKTSTTR
jgi:hypothetical protein